MPLISIMTATWNAEAVVRRLAESLAVQTFRDFEWVVQDGESSDGTCAAVRGWETRLPAVALASQPDTGIYDAWNKALPRARGEWIVFIGADDQLRESTVLERLAPRLRALPPTVEFVSCGMDRLLPDGSVRFHLPGRAEGVAKALPSGLPFGHPALLQRACVFADGGFDTSFRIAGDYDFLCRRWRDDRHGVAVDVTLVGMASGGVSDNPRMLRRSLIEGFRVTGRHFGLWGLVRRCGSLVRRALSLEGWYKIFGSRWIKLPAD